MASLLTLALAACAAAPPRVSVVEQQAAATTARQGRAVRAGRAFPEHPGARKRGFHVVRTRAEWDALWPAPLSAPKIDFSRETILVAFAGEKPSVGHSLALERLTLVGSTLEVTLVEHSPSPGCPLPSRQPTYPALLRAVPRHAGDVRFVVRPQRASSCLSPPALDFSCHVETPEPVMAWQNHAGVPRPLLGQSVACAAKAEPGAALSFELLDAPPGSKIERIGDSPQLRIPIRAQGLFRVGAHALRSDGMASRRFIDFEAGTPSYEIALIEEEPEGVRGLSIEMVRREEHSLPSTPERCALEAPPPPWCSARSDGYEARFAIPATTPGSVEIWGQFAAGEAAPPQARLVISLGKTVLFDEVLPDSPEAWREGRRLVTTLALSDAVLSMPQRCPAFGDSGG
ncbi:MAG: hypothetical protein LBM75_03975 [Myxococcales bacterium]|nr:hypothetical protein [Myxococcales bacterium]